MGSKTAKWPSEWFHLLMRFWSGLCQWMVPNKAWECCKGTCQVFPSFLNYCLAFPFSLQREKLCSAIPHLTLVIRVWLWAVSLRLTCKMQNDSWCNQPVAASWVYLLYIIIIIIIYFLLCWILQKGNLGMETRKELCWAITGETSVPSPTWARTWHLMETVWWDGAVMLQGTTAVGSKPHIAMMLPEHCIDPLVLFGCRVENGFPDVSG